MTESKRYDRSVHAVVTLALWSAPSLCAATTDGQFLEVDQGTRVVTFDLASVQYLQPHRFTIESVDLDKPEIMHLKLTTLSALYSYCGRPVGSYRPAQALLTLGPPDMTLKDIEVSRHEKGDNWWKAVEWYFPYKQLAEATTTGLEEDTALFVCADKDGDSASQYLEDRSYITNGFQVREVFDCDHQLWGMLDSTSAGDPSRATMIEARWGSYAFTQYLRVCWQVLKVEPYVNESEAMKAMQDDAHWDRGARVGELLYALSGDGRSGRRKRRSNNV
jgi:hypothetical protein